MKKVKDNNLFVFVVLSLITTIILYIQGFGIELYFDSYGYQLMADEFIRQGLFNFRPSLVEGTEIAYLFSVRGYSWPWLLAIFKTIAFGTRWGYITLISLFYNFSFAIALPSIIEIVRKKRVGLCGRSAVIFCTMFFFPGLLKYPLSDVPAICLVIVSIFLIIRFKNSDSVYTFLIFLIAGILCGMAYYVRTGALLSSVLIFFWVLIYNDGKWYKKIICTICLVIGIMISMIPQISINSFCNGRVSYLVPISFTSGFAKTEYESGVRDFGYWTNVSGKYPGSIVLSKDELAETLLEQEGYLSRVITPKELLKTIVKYPNEFLGIFMIKLVNLLDTRYGECYISDWHQKNWIRGFLSIILWVFAAYGIGLSCHSVKREGEKIVEIGLLKKNCSFIFLMTAIMIPALFHLAGTHVEGRYFYPCFVVLWIYLFMILDLKKLFLYFKDHFISALFVILFFWGGVNSIWNFTIEKINHYGYFYQDVPIEADIDESIMKCAEDDAGKIEAVVNTFNYDEETKKIYILGNCIKNDQGEEKNDKKIIFVGSEKEYIFDINDNEAGFLYNQTLNPKYKYSEFDFSAYLFDLKKDSYHIYILMDYGDETYIYDTLCSIVR